ncbi:TonB-dependent siderophore receptor [Solitalea longa]|uniref:TonB-dependent siderophore receptor n=1 Tax=Solitalea longa TaxID=2079460 RepID=A0A2S5A7F2_9SPHI|nr:TonB-dependent receptor [Solitalea longa]POY38454.1 TonB-dependent siderophore receptor [Solitalea longa]
MNFNIYKFPSLAYAISFMLILFLGFGATAQTKNGVISGTVKTSDGNPAASVNISLKEINRGTITNELGAFHLKNIKEGTYTLLVSSVGLTSQEKTITVASGQTSTVELTLTETAGQLAEVVVTGAKSVNKKPVTVGRIEIAPMDLPQAVAIIDNKTITEQQVNKLSDAIKNVNGVTLTDNRGTNVETFFARGYNLGANNIMKNGARANSGIVPEASTLESVEVLKGSAALLYGNVSGGAVINMVTKKPKFEYGGEVSMRTGSYSFYKPSVDVYGPISKKLAFRAIGTYENAESFRSSVESKRYYINPSLLYQISSKTDLLVQGDYLNADFTPDFGIGTLTDSESSKIPTTISKSSFFNTPWAYQKAKQATASANLNHQFNAKWKLNSVLAYQNFDRNYFSTERIQANAVGDWNRVLTRTKSNENYYTGQLNLTGDLKTGKIRHQLLVGSDAERYNNTTYTFKKFATAYDKINILDPSKYPLRTDMPVTTDSLRTVVPTNRFGIFVQDLISVSEKFKVLAGLRWSYQNVITGNIHNIATGAEYKTTVKNKDEKAFSPRLGLVYQPTKTTSLFASYSNNFAPNSGVDINNNNLDPSIIDQYEVGVKNDFFQGRLSANLTIYKIINDNYAQSVPGSSNGAKELAGETTSDGLEVDLNGTLAKGLNFLAGYSYTYMRFTNTTGNTGSNKEGERLVGVPSNTANASLFYTFSNNLLNGLKVGFSGFYTGKRNGGYNNTNYINGAVPPAGQPQNRLIPVDGFTTFDLSLGYTYKKLSILGKVSNLADELNYYVHENYSVNPIAPRQFTTTLAYKF